MYRRLALLFPFLWGAACATDTGGDEAEPVREPYIVLQRDFADFMTWQAHELPDIGLRSGHGSASPSWLYVKGTQDAPVDEPMPVGTMMVRTQQIGAPTEWRIHAMVKRGGGYNAHGAVGWEWFDLALATDGTPVITWRGEGDAADPGPYGPTIDGDPLGCNDCHAEVPGNDYVFTRGLISP